MCVDDDVKVFTQRCVRNLYTCIGPLTHLVEGDVVILVRSDVKVSVV